MKFGLIPELIGRFGLIATLSSLTEDDMVHIMTRSEKSCLKEYQRYFADFGKQLIFTEKALRLIAKKAMQENIGARGIKSVMEEILNPYLFSLGTDDLSENIIIDADKEEFLLESAEEKGVGMREEMAIT